MVHYSLTLRPKSFLVTASDEKLGRGWRQGQRFMTSTPQVLLLLSAHLTQSGCTVTHITAQYRHTAVDSGGLYM